MSQRDHQDQMLNCNPCVDISPAKLITFSSMAVLFAVFWYAKYPGQSLSYDPLSRHAAPHGAAGVTQCILGVNLGSL